MKFIYFASREKQPDWKSRKIMKAISWDCSHSLLYVEEGDYRAIYHATGKHKYRDGRMAKGFHKIEGDNLAEFLETHTLHYKVELPVVNAAAGIAFCDANIGKDYSETQLVGFYLPVLKVFLGDGEAELICSEYPIRFAMHPLILNFHFAEDPDWIDPKVCTEVMYSIIGKEMPSRLEDSEGL